MSNLIPAWTWPTLTLLLVVCLFVLYRALQLKKSECEACKERCKTHESRLSAQQNELLEYLKRTRHDMLGALNIVSGFLELLEAQGGPHKDETQKSYLGHMSAGVRRSVSIADGLEKNYSSATRTTGQ
jgi:hypothetical protein